MKSLPRTVALGALPLFVLATGAGAQTRVQILHASDLEGGVDAIDDAPNFAAVVEALEADAAGQGVTSLLLSAGDNYIPGPFFSAAGDSSLRTAFRRTLQNAAAREAVGRADVSIMNLLGFDASCVGNHEFDAGTSIMRDIIGTDIRDASGNGVLDEPRWLGAQFPYLSSNLDFSSDGALSGIATSQILPSSAFESPINDLAAAAAAPKLAPATIVEKAGERFGIVGATTPLVGTISSIGGTTVVGPGAGTNDMVALAALVQPVIDQLTMAGVDKIILVSHLQQLALEQQLVPLLRDVDIAIAGGSDTLLADADDRLRAGDVAQGTYPVVASNAASEPTLIVSTDGQYGYVGRLVVDFDVNGVVVPGSVVSAESGAFATDQQGVSDLWATSDPFASGRKGSVVRGLTDAVRGVVIAKDGNVFGSSSVFLEGRRNFVRTEETNLGNLTADANLFVARQADPTVRVSLKNGGGIRAEIGSINGITGALEPTLANPQSGKLAGEISQLDIENSLRFNNGLSLITLTRAQLKEVLEHAVASTTPTSTPGQFAQVGGVAFSYDIGLPVGNRVLNAGLLNQGPGLPFFVVNGAVVGNEPIRVVTLDFLAGGGDGYPYPNFVSADPVFANRVDLPANPLLPAGVATFVDAGTEQDALAEFLAANHMTVPYATEDQPISFDYRIQNLFFRPDEIVFTVLRAIQ